MRQLKESKSHEYFKPKGNSNTFLEVSYLHSYISLDPKSKMWLPIPPLYSCLLRICSNVTAQVESIFPLSSHHLNLVPHSNESPCPWSPICLTHVFVILILRGDLVLFLLQWLTSTPLSLYQSGIDNICSFNSFDTKHMYTRLIILILQVRKLLLYPLT